MFVVLRRVCLVFVSGVLAVLGVLGAPSASAQEAPPPALSYTVKTVPANLAHVQNGDAVKITISGLPAGATAVLRVCPATLPDTLLKGIGAAVPQHDVTARVNAYCGVLNDELAGAEYGQVSRNRSATTHDIVYDTTIPRGPSVPAYVAFDPSYTSFDKSEPFFPWADNPVVSTSPDGTKIRQRKWSFSCDETHPCTFALHLDGVVAGTPAAAQDNSITFAPTAPGLSVEGCAGIGPNTLDASMPERFGRTAVTWNQLLCAPTNSNQPTNIVAENEDTGLKAFDTGASDVVFTGSGGTLATQTTRDRQYVPVGLNAAVIAAVGWSPTDVDDGGGQLISQFATHLDFGFDDVANLLSKSGQTPEAPETPGRGGIFVNDAPLVKRNPDLAAIDFGGNPGAGLNARARAGALYPDFYGVTGESGAGTVPLALSETLASAAPNAWKFPDQPATAYSGKSPGVITSLDALSPAGLQALRNMEPKVGQLAVRKTVNNATIGTGGECASGCLNWIVTDLATATHYGWAIAALPNGHGGYVTPTTQSLQAAASSMKEGKDGTLQPGTVSDPDGYPLTFGEYLAAPVNPLIDANCKPLQGKQDQLTAYLAMARAGGQNALSPGMAPLTPALATEANQRVAKVGTGTTGAACHEQAAANNPPPTSPGGGAGATPTSNTGASSTPVGTGPAPLVAPLKAATPSTVSAAKNLADSVRIPAFFGGGVLGALIPLLALVVLAVLPSATGYLAAGKPLPPWLISLLGRVRIGRGEV